MEPCNKINVVVDLRVPRSRATAHAGPRAGTAVNTERKVIIIIQNKQTKQK